MKDLDDICQDRISRGIYTCDGCEGYDKCTRDAKKVMDRGPRDGNCPDCGHTNRHPFHFVGCPRLGAKFR